MVILASYTYKAKTNTGQTVTGSFEAKERDMVITFLKEKGYIPLSIVDTVAEKGKEVKIGGNKKVKAKELAIFCRQFKTMLTAGVSLIGCLDMLKKQTENPTLKQALVKIYENVQKGKTLSDSMKSFENVFPVLLISMVEVGEVSGTLETVLDRLALQFEKDNKIRSKVTTAMTYPAVIGCIALVMVTFMMIFIVPKFVNMVASVGGTLPTPTKIVMFVSGLFTNIVFLICFAAVIFGLSYGFKKFKKTEQGKFIIDSFIYKMPMVGKNVQKILASRFTRTLSTLLSSGVSLIQSLEVVDKVVNNQIVSRGIVKVKEDIKSGSSLSGPLESLGIFPVMVTQMISVGEEAGSLDSIMEKVADFYDEEVDTSISKLVAMLEPLMMMLLAIIVGFIVVAMILPVFSMNQAIH